MPSPLGPTQTLVLRALAAYGDEDPTAHAIANHVWSDAGWQLADARKAAGVLRSLLHRGLAFQPRRWCWSLTDEGRRALSEEEK